MAHPARVRMMQRLVPCKAIMYENLVPDNPLASSTIAQHLRTLERTGYMIKEMHGNVAGCAVDRTNYLLSLSAMRETLRTDRVSHRRYLLVEERFEGE